MANRKVGIYFLGNEAVKLELREGDGAEFFAAPAKICLGADCSLRKVIELLLHETLEFCLYRDKCRFHPSNSYVDDYTAYLFVFSHVQLTDACAKQAEFLTGCMDDLMKAWKRWRKEMSRK
jgi:hypothetical protein